MPTRDTCDDRGGLASFCANLPGVFRWPPRNACMGGRCKNGAVGIFRTQAPRFRINPKPIPKTIETYPKVAPGRQKQKKTTWACSSGNPPRLNRAHGFCICDRLSFKIFWFGLISCRPISGIRSKNKYVKYVGKYDKYVWHTWHTCSTLQDKCVKYVKCSC